MNHGFVAAAIVCCACVLWWMVKSEKGATCFAISAFQGIASLFAVNLVGMVTGISLAVNWYTIGAFAVLGLPGVCTALILNLFFGV